jgi:hypothetical protein
MKKEKINEETIGWYDKCKNEEKIKQEVIKWYNKQPNKGDILLDSRVISVTAEITAKRIFEEIEVLKKRWLK